jgi:ABC-type sugar transport system ATPase subunit
MIYVTHDQVEAMTLADRIVVLNHGRIEQVGTPAALYHEPANRFVAEFLGSPRMNLLPATLQHGTVTLATGASLALDPARVSGDATTHTPAHEQRGPAHGSSRSITLGVRPEDLRLAAIGANGADDTDGATLPITITLVEELGETRLVHATLTDGTPIVLRDRSEPPPRKGDRRTVVVDMRKIHLFDDAGRRMETAEPIARPSKA